MGTKPTAANALHAGLCWHAVESWKQIEEQLRNKSQHVTVY